MQANIIVSLANIGIDAKLRKFGSRENKYSL